MTAETEKPVGFEHTPGGLQAIALFESYIHEVPVQLLGSGGDEFILLSPYRPQVDDTVVLQLFEADLSVSAQVTRVAGSQVWVRVYEQELNNLYSMFARALSSRARRLTAHDEE